MRRAGQVTLATALTRDESARPYASLALVALDHGGSPLLLLSDLADHTRNIAEDARISLLFDGTGGWRDPLAGPRASVLGRAVKTEAAGLLDRFTARHPGARDYAGFQDFNLYQVAVEAAHLVAGFGQIHWVEAGEVLLDTAGSEALVAAEADIVAHMNQDHRPALDLIARNRLGLTGAGWEMTGIDPEGFDLRLETRLARADFPEPVSDAQSARAALVRLTKDARREQD